MKRKGIYSTFLPDLKPLAKAIKNAGGKSLSKHEETFAIHLLQANIPEQPEREYKFHPERKWRFDFAFVSHKLAVEIDGGRQGGRHMRYEGFNDDCDKLNEAILMGWRVLRFTDKQIGTLEAIRITREALKS